jgi:hypothetical protein
LASAWRAARSSSSEQWRLSRIHEADAAFGRDAQPQPVKDVESLRPTPLPPKFPVLTSDECELFQEGFLVSPRAKCQHVIYAENIDGCTCTINLPGNINPQPANLYNPYLPEIPPDPLIPLPEPMATVPPPSNPLQPYVPPMMPPECPFVTACSDPDSFECIGYNSWGFAEAAMAGYTPAAASLNMVSCTYVMHPYGEFKVPRRMKALWRLNAKQIKVLKRLDKPFTMECKHQNVTSATQQDFCNDKVQRLKFACATKWVDVAKATARSCAEAPAPDGFRRDSTLQELCPRQCGWEKNTIRWPPYLTTEEKKAAEEAKAIAKNQTSSE